MKKLPPFGSQVRNYTALVSAFIYNLNVFGLSAKNICAPGFNCHGCPWATFSCPVGIIGYGFGVRSIPAFALGSVLAIGIFLGRLICGYACPFGLLQDILFRIKSRKFSLPRPVRYVKYILMILFVFVLTYLFGFNVKEGYIRINKPVIAKDVPELDKSIFAKKNSSYFNKEKYNTVVTKGGFPVPSELLTENSDGGDFFSNGLKPIGVSGINSTGNSSSASLDDILQELDGVNKSESMIPSQAESVSGSLKPIGIAKSSGGAELDDLFSEQADTSEKIESGGGESVFDFLERSKEESYKNSKLIVEVTVENLSTHSVDGFIITPVYYAHGTGEEIWRGEDKVYSEVIPAGELFTTEIFEVPYYIYKADLTILSPQTAVAMDYWTLFCTYCPVAAIEADIPSKISGIEDLSQLVYATTKMSPVRLLITFFVIIASIFISRFFCRGLCPLGAMYGLISRFAILRITLVKDSCIDCGKCDRVCPIELDVRKEVGGSECISCGDCVKACPTAALKRKVGL